MNFHEAGIPAKLHDRDWSDLRSSSGVDAVRSWLNGYPERWLPPTAEPDRCGQGLLLYGDAGTGKSTAAAMLIKQVMTFRPDWCWFVSASNLETMLHRYMDLGMLIRKSDDIDTKTVDKFEEIMSRLDRARMRYFVLCIDDWGRGRDSGSAFLQDFVEGLVRERFARGLPTIITTNLDLDAIEDRYGRPWVSFMREAFIPIDFGDRDFRGAR